MDDCFVRAVGLTEYYGRQRGLLNLDRRDSYA